MMDVGKMTHAWAPTTQESSLKHDKGQNLSPEEQKKLLHGENLGEYLNKIADPNWVDPAKMRHVGKNDLDKDDFLKLFLAQLKNQDPTNPMKNYELAAQLAQFTSLEKLTNIDSSLSTMAKKGDQTREFDALALIGKGISGDSSKIFRDDTTAHHTIEFKLGAPAKDVTLSIQDATGHEVKKFVAHDLKPGANKIEWNGILDNGAPAPKGQYHVEITAKNIAGQKVAVETAFTGRVTGVNFTPEGPVLMIGKKTVKLKDVRQIFTEMSPQDNATLVKAKAVAGKPGEHKVTTDASAGGNLENVGMSQGLINKLNHAVDNKTTPADTNISQAINNNQESAANASAQTAKNTLKL